MPRGHALCTKRWPVLDCYGTSRSKPTVVSPTLKVGPAATHLDCGIRGQDFRLSLAHNTTASLERPMRLGTAFPFHLVVPTGLSVLHICCRVAFHMQIHDSVE